MTVPFTQIALARLRAAQDQASDARALLAQHALTDGAEHLSDEVQRIAALEARCSVFGTAASIPADEIPRWFLEVALRSSDDKWSGRGNDLRRVAADATREAIRELQLAAEAWS